MTLDELRQLTAPLGSKPLETFLGQIEDLQRQVAVGAERLAKAMDREKAKDAQIKTLTAELKAANQAIEQYDAHPDVIAAKLAKLDIQEAQIKAQRAKLQLQTPTE